MQTLITAMKMPKTTAPIRTMKRKPKLEKMFVDLYREGVKCALEKGLFSKDIHRLEVASRGVA